MRGRGLAGGGEDGGAGRVVAVAVADREWAQHGGVRMLLLLLLLLLLPGLLPLPALLHAAVV